MLPAFTPAIWQSFLYFVVVILQMNPFFELCDCSISLSKAPFKEKEFLSNSSRELLIARESASIRLGSIKLIPQFLCSKSSRNAVSLITASLNCVKLLNKAFALRYCQIGPEVCNI